VFDNLWIQCYIKNNKKTNGIKHLAAVPARFMLLVLLFLMGIIWMHTLPLDLCQYFRQKKLKGHAAFFSYLSSFC